MGLVYPYVSVGIGVRTADDSATIEPDWPFPHPSRGTCRPGCERYGACHCGCGQTTTISVLTDAEHDRFKGRPFVFVSGHHARVFRRHGGGWTRHGVDAERVRPLIFRLRDRLGSIRAVADALGMPESTVRGYVYSAVSSGFRQRLPTRSRSSSSSTDPKAPILSVSGSSTS